MPLLNAVDVVQAELNIGDDQAFYVDVDASEDDSGLDISDWDVEARFANSAVRKQQALVNPALTIPMTYELIEEEGEEDVHRFNGLLESEDSIDSLTPGPVTMQIWRTNSGALKLLLHVNFTALATTIDITP